MSNVPLRGVIVPCFESILVKTRHILRSLAGCNDENTVRDAQSTRHILRPLAGCNQKGRVNRPFNKRHILRPLAGCNGKSEQKQAAANRQKRHFFHKPEVIIAYSAQKEKPESGNEAAFCGANSVGNACGNHKILGFRTGNSNCGAPVGLFKVSGKKQIQRKRSGYDGVLERSLQQGRQEQ